MNTASVVLLFNDRFVLKIPVAGILVVVLKFRADVCNKLIRLAVEN